MMNAIKKGDKVRFTIYRNPMPDEIFVGTVIRVNSDDSYLVHNEIFDTDDLVNKGMFISKIT